MWSGSVEYNSNIQTEKLNACWHKQQMERVTKS